MTATHTSSAASCNRIDLIDKNNTGSVPLSFFKQITDSGCTNTNKHFHEIRT